MSRVCRGVVSEFANASLGVGFFFHAPFPNPLPAKGIMSGAGLVEPCMIWLPIFQKNGCGSWKKSEPWWRFYIPRVENACMPCGNNYPDDVRVANLFPLWKGCGTCFCGLPKPGSAIVLSSPNRKFPGPTMLPRGRDRAHEDAGTNCTRL